jgi:hypothetical protein
MTDLGGTHFVVAFRSMTDIESGDAEDVLDLHRLSFPPLSVSQFPTINHIAFRPGDTSFENTGTLYVERSGRLLVSSSYRWAEDEVPGDTSYVSRIDELPS